MALSSKTLINYGISISSVNRYLDFINVSGGTQLTATLKLGYYSLSSLAIEIKRAIEEIDATNTYTVSFNRAVTGGTRNRITIETSGIYLDMIFVSGSNSGSSIAGTIGYLMQDYSGNTKYSGISSVGTTLISEYVGYNYIPPTVYKEIQGSVTLSASGVKESIVFSIMEFFQVQFKYEPKSKLSEWGSFFNWAIQQRVFEIIPEIDDPSVFYECTLDKSTSGSKGLAFKMTELLPAYPNNYDTGICTFRRVVPVEQFI